MHAVIKLNHKAGNSAEGAIRLPERNSINQYVFRRRLRADGMIFEMIPPLRLFFLLLLLGRLRLLEQRPCILPTSDFRI